MTVGSFANRCVFIFIVAASALQAQQPLPRKTLADLIPAAPTVRPLAPWKPRAIDDEAVIAAGIRKLIGRHLILYTDVPSRPDVDELPAAFDLAVPQWCAYFGLDPNQAASWRNIGSLMQDKERFRRAGLLPDELPAFQNGYQRGPELWLYEQPTKYYRRHLLLHEGTHAFMFWSLGGAGPTWYMEGTAELLGTHQWRDGKLTLRHMPATKEEVDGWGRIKIVKDAYRENRAMALPDIFRLQPADHLQVERYGWCWAAAAFFDGHPTYRDRFRELRKFARDDQPSFNERFLGWYRDDVRHLQREWQWFVANAEYGFDLTREAIERKPVRPLVGTTTVEIASDRGWQSTGVRIEAGHKYRLSASGMFQLAQQPKTWWSEPNGVTIRYFRGQPLGILLGAIVEESEGSVTDSGFTSSAAIGLGLETTPSRSGTLYFRLNDSPAELHDNAGAATVTISLVE